MEVAKSRDIQTLMSLLPQYDGIVIQDSYTGWMSIGSNRQMCLAHQIRIPKKDLKYKKLDSETTNFLNDLCAILKGLYGTDKTKGVKKRLEAADSFDAQPRLPDESGIQRRRRVQHCQISKEVQERKGLYDHVSLSKRRVPPDNNSCERANRVVVCVRGDGGGNRTEKGMRANSILFTIKLTDKINERSFYDHMIRAASASGDR